MGPNGHYHYQYTGLAHLNGSYNAS